MNDWLHNLPIVWMALLVFGLTALVTAAIYLAVTVLSVGERARSFKAVSPFMLGGAFGYRLPPTGWKPQDWTPPVNSNVMITTGNVDLKDAHKTLQFWLIWAVLCLNVSAGIGIIGAASPMLQETFGGRLFGDPLVGFAQFSDAQKAQAALVGAAFVRAVLAVQYRRPLLLGILVRQSRAEEDLFHLLHPRLPLLRSGPDPCHARHARAIRGRLLPHCLDVWRRVRHRPCLSRRYLRHALRFLPASRLSLNSDDGNGQKSPARRPRSPARIVSGTDLHHLHTGFHDFRADFAASTALRLTLLTRD